MTCRGWHASALAVAVAFAFATLSIKAAAVEATKVKAAAPTDCTIDGTPMDYARKADLPPGVVEALGFPMAEAGEPFQATDVIRAPRLPFERFVSARRTGCRLQLRYERGGIALRRETVDVDLLNGKWTVRKSGDSKPADTE